MIDIPLPRLLNSSGVFQRRLRPIRATVELKMVPLSTASLQLPEDETLPERSYVEMYTSLGSAGIYRVRSPQNSYGEGTVSSELEHAITEVGDYLVRSEYNEMMAAKAAMTTLFSHYRGSRWQLGDTNILGSTEIAVNVNYDNVLTAMLGVLDQLSGYMMTFDFSTSPWTIGFAALDTTVSAEGRLSRNIQSARVTYDDTDLCTRAYYCYESTSGGTTTTVWDKVQSETYDTYGKIERTVQTSGFTQAEALYAANEYLRKHQYPKVYVEISAQDLSQITGEAFDTFRIGKLFRLSLPDYNLTVEKNITGMSWDDIYGRPTEVTVNLADEEDTTVTYIHKTTSSSSGKSSSSGGGSRVSDVKITNNVVKVIYSDGTSKSYDRNEINITSVTAGTVYGTTQVSIGSGTQGGSGSLYYRGTEYKRQAITLGASGVIASGHFLGEDSSALNIDHYHAISLSKGTGADAGKLVATLTSPVATSDTSSSKATIDISDISSNVADVQPNGNVLTITYADGTTKTFSKAATLSGAWSGNVLTVSANTGGTPYTAEVNAAVTGAGMSNFSAVAMVKDDAGGVNPVQRSYQVIYLREVVDGTSSKVEAYYKDDNDYDQVVGIVGTSATYLAGQNISLDGTWTNNQVKVKPNRGSAEYPITVQVGFPPVGTGQSSMSVYAQSVDSKGGPNPVNRDSKYLYLIQTVNGTSSKVSINTESDGSGTELALISTQATYIAGQNISLDGTWTNNQVKVKPNRGTAEYPITVQVGFPSVGTGQSNFSVYAQSIDSKGGANPVNRDSKYLYLIESVNGSSSSVKINTASDGSGTNLAQISTNATYQAGVSAGSGTNLSAAWSSSRFTVTASPQSKTYHTDISVSVEGGGTSNFSAIAKSSDATTSPSGTLTARASTTVYLKEVVDGTNSKVNACTNSNGTGVVGSVSSLNTYNAGQNAVTISQDFVKKGSGNVDETNTELLWTSAPTPDTPSYLYTIAAQGWSYNQTSKKYENIVRVRSRATDATGDGTMRLRLVVNADDAITAATPAIQNAVKVAAPVWDKAGSQYVDDSNIMTITTNAPNPESGTEREYEFLMSADGWSNGVNTVRVRRRTNGSDSSGTLTLKMDVAAPPDPHPTQYSLYCTEGGQVPGQQLFRYKFTLESQTSKSFSSGNSYNFYR